MIVVICILAMGFQGVATWGLVLFGQIADHDSADGPRVGWLSATAQVFAVAFWVLAGAQL